MVSSVSPSTSNYFALFSLPESFQVVDADLEKAYRALQAAHHPDRVAGGDDKARLQALQETSRINDAYATLKSPVKRAAYLLGLAGVNADQHNQAHLQEDFLLKQMQLREKLEALVDADDLDGLDAMKKAVDEDKTAELERFDGAYQAPDYEAAKGIYHKLQFLFKLRDEIDAAEEKLLDY